MLEKPSDTDEQIRHQGNLDLEGLTNQEIVAQIKANTEKVNRAFGLALESYNNGVQLSEQKFQEARSAVLQLINSAIEDVGKLESLDDGASQAVQELREAVAKFSALPGPQLLQPSEIAGFISKINQATK